MFKNKIVIKIRFYVLHCSSKWGEIGANMVFCVLHRGKCCERFSRKSQEHSPSTNSCQRRCCGSVAQSCLTLHHSVDCSMPGASLLHRLMEFAQVHVRWVGWHCLTISFSAVLFSFCLQSFPASSSFPVSWLFKSGGRSIGASASATVLPVQGWFPLGLAGLISWQSKGLSRIFSSTTVWKYQFFGA